MTYLSLSPKTKYLVKEHQKVHRDEKEVGPIGSIARYKLRHWNKEFGGDYPEDEIDDDDFYHTIAETYAWNGKHPDDCIQRYTYTF